MQTLDRALIVVYLPNGAMSTALLSPAALSLLADEVVAGAYQLKELPMSAETLTILPDRLTAER